MNFPFNAFTEMGIDATLLVSLFIGIGFGFMLEKGGFGSSKVLAGIFYGKDWRVLKVMFTAIVTAMLGLYASQGLGLVNMDLINFRPTFLGGQIVGGLLLGAGFVTAGYCPGTS
ncbi:MAG: YeeE/YedE family protein, partial [Planctomycetes bacterium]|nr:YeeE/YedE family protein [Planctomycetota bacterium]